MAEEPTQRRPVGGVSALLRILIAFLLMAPLSFLCITASLLVLPSRSLRICLGNLYGKTVGPLVFRLAGIRARIENPERLDSSRPAMYLSNHSSTLDMWVGMWLCPFGGCGVAKKEIVRVPFFGQTYLLSGHLLLDRSNRERAIASMEKARRVVQSKRLSLWMWPEGTRSRSGRLQPLKKGFAHMAVATRLPIVPVVLHGADRLWPARSFRTVPGTLRIEVLEPIDTSDWSTETIDEHVEAIWQVFQTQLEPRQQAELPEPPPSKGAD